MDEVMRRIAGGLELWFERPGFPPVPSPPKLPRPWQCRAQRVAPNIMPEVGGKKLPEQGRFFVEGAH
jgi:hypothetical protein